MRANRALALALALALAPRPASAGIANSPHDLVGQGYDVDRGGGSQERCTICHAPARGGLRGLAHEVPPSVRNSYGVASLVCFSCHDGITLALPEVDASMTAFHPASHGHHLAPYPALKDQGIELPALTGDHMECTTCHDPHDDSRRPFLRAPVAGLCLLCHSPLAETPAEGVRSAGNHPMGRDPAEAARSSMPVEVGAPFRVAFPAPYPLQKGKGSVGTHWDLGGHLLAGGAGALECATCHAVHGDEVSPPLPRLLALDPVDDVADRFCEGCHRGRRGDGAGAEPAGASPNPGGTAVARTYHPCDDDAGNGDGRLVEVSIPEGWPLGGGAPARLLCDTCHRAHGAEPGTQLLRPPGPAASFCEVCHGQVLLEHHHPTADEGGACSDSHAARSPDGTASFACGLCHRAHNAGLGAAEERDFVPLLRETRRSDDLCRRCHTAENPTCGPKSTHLASHFLGDPALRDTYDDADPPVRTDPWPESGLSSLYGGAERKSILCLSCHSFSRGALTLTGDDGQASHLLARTGNPVEWKEGEEARYLCTGCHGVRPGTGPGTKGHTHPLMDADVAALGAPVRPPASATGGGRMNCDSCHRPHEAVTAAGVYIMEAARGANTDPMAIGPKIDFTPTCHLCHDASKY